MNIDELKKEIRSTKSIKDKPERLEALNFLTQQVADDFTESLSLLEYEIEYVLDRTSEKIKNELGYTDVSSVTQDINVRSSWEY
jgi:hypothetical protein